MRIQQFEEKPENPKSNLASMGIYIFNKGILKKFLKADAKDKTSEHDFGKNVIPALLDAKESVYAYPFEGYWKDVGTIESLWQANMDLLADEPALSLNDKDWRVYSGNQVLPPHYLGPESSVKGSLIAEGSQILGSVIHSVIFYNVTIAAGAKVSDAVIMPGTVIEAGARVEKAIVGERCHIHAGTKIANADGSVAVLGNDAEAYPVSAANEPKAEKGGAGK
jgi:glucose-1-phosphate adenylyltransferase